MYQLMPQSAAMTMQRNAEVVHCDFAELGSSGDLMSMKVHGSRGNDSYRLAIPVVHF